MAKEPSGKLNASKMSDKRKRDLALLTNKLRQDRWYLTAAAVEWNRPFWRGRFISTSS
jgi:hypothetical protein